VPFRPNCRFWVTPARPKGWRAHGGRGREEWGRLESGDNAKTGSIPGGLSLVPVLYSEDSGWCIGSRPASKVGVQRGSQAATPQAAVANRSKWRALG
jgi:hypothetical protein